MEGRYSIYIYIYHFSCPLIEENSSTPGTLEPPERSVCCDQGKLTYQFELFFFFFCVVLEENR